MQIPASLGDTVKEHAAEHIELLGRIKKMSFLISSAGNHVSPLFSHAMRRTMWPVDHARAIHEAKSGVKPPHSKMSLISDSKSQTPGNGDDRFQRKWFLDILLSCQKELNCRIQVQDSRREAAVIICFY